MKDVLAAPQADTGVDPPARCPQPLFLWRSRCDLPEREAVPCNNANASLLGIACRGRVWGLRRLRLVPHYLPPIFL